jgi:hypothetical protein
MGFRVLKSALLHLKLKTSFTKNLDFLWKTHIFWSKSACLTVKNESKSSVSRLSGTLLMSGVLTVRAAGVNTVWSLRVGWLSEGGEGLFFHDVTEK